ncbi:uncharacterized protein LAESUDRAFT_811942 [Laetiporus sulphureus 93-53]|uniref:N-acetyltransferase domain-containing protein n=1 Tax=Laetiporus sulphureus 93-53 TaxID=1314785 RepID=A0A165ESZ1_9APHY|nr:uncharacterized protein LAESUDRAFT_811942 [Laetiporus sulphureus 93-53]KZT07691.1 hypothetical protein LAESUDRAFT_811942 [Laetiporus sulphureus 93-53]
MLPIIPKTAGGPVALRLEECAARVEVKKWHPHPAVMQSLTVEATHLRLGKIGKLAALKITRGPIIEEGLFLEIFDEEQDELAAFSQTLFNKYGEIRPWLVEDEKLKSTGCWGRELNDGTIFYIFHVLIYDPALRGQGLGSWILQRLLSSSLVGEKDTVISWPTPMPSRDAASKEQWTDGIDRAVFFMRKNGFRRIGLTQFLAYSPKPKHLSRAIPASKDAPLMLRHSGAFPISDLANRMPMRWPNAKLLSSSEEFPLHDRILRLKLDKIVKYIREAFGRDALAIRQKDKDGFTPLHMAAAAINIAAVKTLLELGAQENVFDKDNSDWKTPLMRWTGYAEDGLLVEATLRRAMGEDIGADMQFVQAKKWGCTCGHCVGGWLSPLLIHRLVKRAEELYDMLPEMTDSYFPVPRRPIDRADIEWDLALPYVPPHLHEVIFKTFHSGYRFVFGAIAQVLRELGATNPSPQRMAATQIRERVLFKLSGQSPWVYDDIFSFLNTNAVNFYFAKGGKVEYAPYCVVDTVGMDYEWCAIDPKAAKELEAEYGQFPTWGPYIGPDMSYDPYEGMESDSEDDDGDSELEGYGESDSDEGEEDMDTEEYDEDDEEDMEEAEESENGRFLEVLDEDDELAAVSQTLFDKYGEARPWLVDDDKLKGTER